METKRFITTTGAAAEHLPPDGPERDELLGLVRLGLRFREQHRGKRPGLLARTVFECAKRAGPPYSFAGLLTEFDLLAANRAAASGPSLPPISRVSRVWGIITFHDPKRGEIEVPFSTLRGHLTAAKKCLKA